MPTRASIRQLFARQTSAAAFTKAMLDLEGASLTPILVSLVNKDASMLEAFGKGASDDIAEAKEALYQVSERGQAVGPGRRRRTRASSCHVLVCHAANCSQTASRFIVMKISKAQPTNDAGDDLGSREAR